MHVVVAPLDRNGLWPQVVADGVFPIVGGLMVPMDRRRGGCIAERLHPPATGMLAGVRR